MYLSPLDFIFKMFWDDGEDRELCKTVGFAVMHKSYPDRYSMTSIQNHYIKHYKNTSFKNLDQW